MIFKNAKHEKFFMRYINKYHLDNSDKALLYCLGLSNQTRDHISEIYLPTKKQLTGSAISILKKKWQNEDSILICWFAISMFIDMEDKERIYNNLKIFSSENSYFFLETLRIRFPDQTASPLKHIPDRGSNLLYLKSIDSKDLTYAINHYDKMRARFDIEYLADQPNGGEYQPFYAMSSESVEAFLRYVGFKISDRYEADDQIWIITTNGVSVSIENGFCIRTKRK